MPRPDDEDCTCAENPDNPHSCPYAEEIEGDFSASCDCCDACERECAMNI